MELLSFSGLMAILSIILIDLVLAGDNALVIGMAAAKLPAHLKRKAIIWGTIGAIGVRVICIGVITWLMLIPGLHLIGGLALLWIAWRLVFENKDHNIKPAAGFWSAMSTIVVADAVMGFDNALAIAAAAQGNWYLIILGLLISIPLVIVGAELIGKLLHRWPNVIYLGSFTLFVVAAKMIFKEPMLEQYIKDITYVPWLFGIIAVYLQWIVKLGWPFGVYGKLLHKKAN